MATSGTRTFTLAVDEIIEEGVKKTTRGPQRRDTIQLKIENYLIIIVLKAFCYFVFIFLGSLLFFKFKKKYFQI